MIVSTALRFFQLLFSAVVLILASLLIHGFGGPGHLPSIIDYGSFCGACALIIAIIGAISLFIDKLQGIIMLVLDVFAEFFLFAGAAAYAAKVRTGDCTDFLGYIQTLNGVINVSDLKNYNNSEQAAVNDATARCRMVQAETAFLWILVVCYVGTIVLAFFGRSGNKDGALV